MQGLCAQCAHFRSGTPTPSKVVASSIHRPHIVRICLLKAAANGLPGSAWLESSSRQASSTAGDTIAASGSSDRPAARRIPAKRYMQLMRLAHVCTAHEYATIWLSSARQPVRLLPAIKAAAFAPSMMAANADCVCIMVLRASTLHANWVRTAQQDSRSAYFPVQSATG